MEPSEAAGRVITMKRMRTPRMLLSVLAVIVLILAACGDDETPVSTGSDSGDAVADTPGSPADGEDGAADEEPIPVEPDEGIGDGAEPLPDTPPPSNETVITDTDMVDPKLTAPYEVVVNPDDPTVLWVRFIGGDPNCTAAEAILLTETPDEVNVELQVGITQDALSRSCLAGEFNLRVDVPLNESAEGKRISWAQPTGGDEPQLVTPDLTVDDFVGIPQAEAEALADENIIPWRIGRIDGEFFALTEDYNPGRLTFEIDDGIVTAAVLG